MTTARTVHHLPVLLKESLEGLRLRPGGRWIDATLGGGGHAAGILERSSPDGLLLGIDQDEQALAMARERLAEFGGRLVTARGNFRDLAVIAREEGWWDVDGILLDLGFSSLQIDEPERGFSFRNEARLDMRMDRREPLTAFDVVNGYPRDELARIFRELGDERRARRIAASIVEERRRRPIETTGELAGLVAKVSGKTGGRINPATRVFQALRIFVNKELDNLATVLPAAVDLLKPGGRLAVISYHSLEERVVKERLRFLSGTCACPPRQPVCTCDAVSKVAVVTRRPIVPQPGELARNRRARSAKLRVAERLGGAA